MLELGTTGMAINVSSDGTHLDEAAELERLGYSTIWLPGGQLDTLDRISDLARATTSVRVAPGIIPPARYRAAEVRELYAQLEETAPDRFVVGLGGPQQRRSIGPLNSYLDELDAGDPPVPAGRRILAALGPRKLDLARDRCAGALTLLVSPDYTARARRVLGADANLVVDQFVVLDTDAGRARETARGRIRFLSGVAGYRANFARMGYSEAEIAELDDRLVDDLVLWGDAETIVEGVDRHRRAGADHIVLSAVSEGDQPDTIDVARELAGRLVG